MKIQEFDLHITPTKLVKVQGLAKLLTNSNCKALDVNTLSITPIPNPNIFGDLNQVQDQTFIQKQYISINI